MKYMGGKFHLGKYLAPIVLESEPKTIIEPFIGGGNFTSHIFKLGFDGRYITGDFDPDLNYMWRSVIEDKWLPKNEDKISKDDYFDMKIAGFSENPLRGFSRTTASFSGVPWGSYALLDKYKRDYWKEGVTALTKQAKIFENKNIEVAGGDYSLYGKYLEENAIVYCDPPYYNTAGYGTNFDHGRFWETMEKWSAICPVYVSEQTAPAEWVSIFDKEHHYSISKYNTKVVTEKLFVNKMHIN